MKCVHVHEFVPHGAPRSKKRFCLFLVLMKKRMLFRNFGKGQEATRYPLKDAIELAFRFPPLTAFYRLKINYFVQNPATN